MKLTIIISAFAGLTIMSCNSNSTSNQASTSVKDSSAPASNASTDPKEQNIAVKGIVAHYIQLKTALSKDNGEGAATAGKAMVADFAKVDESGFTAEQKKGYADIAGDAKEMAEHIGANAGKLAHQREHFDMLSTDIYDLVKLFGASQALYVDHCPMYNNKKGAIWLSETKEIINPYMGSAMSTCGTIKEQL